MSQSWAPTRIAWSYDNRTAGFRIVGGGDSLRIESRLPGADANPYLAYAAAAHLDPDTDESRELYKIFQETSGQVDAARNLGGGIANLARALGRDKGEEDNGSDD